MDVVTAINEGLVDAHGIGNGIQSMTLSLSATPELNFIIAISVTPGTIFEANSAGTQNLVAIGPNRGGEVFYPGQKGATTTVNVACINMHLAEPSSSDTFSVQLLKPGDLTTLVNSDDFFGATSRVQQFAIWTITDNPARGDFVGLEPVPGEPGDSGPPTSDEINQIRQIFKSAGIATSKYAALK